MEVTGDVHLSADVRVSPSAHPLAVGTRESRVVVREDIRALQSTLLAAGVPVRLVPTGDGGVELAIGLVSAPHAPRATLHVVGSLTVDPGIICDFNVEVRGDFILGANGVVFGNALVQGNAVLEESSVVSGEVEVRGDASLAPHASVTSLFVRGQARLSRGATVLDALDAENLSSEEGDADARRPAPKRPRLPPRPAPVPKRATGGMPRESVP